MYLDEQSPDASGAPASGWQVDPAQVRDFAAAVDQVRRDLNRISSEVNTMSTPNYAPMLGTSPVGQELAEKFTDRMGSEDGLRGLLDAALKRMDEFVTAAEKTAAAYQAHDEGSAAGFRSS
jgi:hypothetical protein